ncbi:uncharacterized protein LOC110451888 [Mizuhopecten yessoensis]|uniref:Uncharacterized protein n=1 Tax=Mizuhopecten yessoensis TaxID=6573 RepID=A0A210QKX3_MIZYE|nr:uncharacterized protein LOC110451888 [Mizuhopecten yessoensis]OWF49387.1 hypothetical protein KP79_PYT11812 [Mizuhopecten yessoensis]
MRGSQGKPLRSRSEGNRKNNNQRKRSSDRSEKEDRDDDQEETESDDKEKNDDQDGTKRPRKTRRPSSRTTPFTKSATTLSFTTTPNSASNTTTATTTTSSSPTNRNPGRTSTQITTLAMSVTTTPMQRLLTSTPTFAPHPENSSSNKVTITVLAVMAGLVFFIVILLALCLAWRKWCKSRPPTDVTPRDKSTYHMYSEIDHTTIILDEDTRGASNQRVTAANDRAVPSAPLYEDIPDTLVNENAYDILHQKEQVKSKDTYSVLDPRLVDFNDSRLNTYDVTSDIIGQSVSSEKTSGTFVPDLQIVSEATVPQVGQTSGHTSDNINFTTNNSVHTDPTDHCGQYFALEKVPDVTESQNNAVQEHPIDSGSDNYFKLEPLTMT